jgi:type IV pilus assembly protein PilB
LTLTGLAAALVQSGVVTSTDAEKAEALARSRGLALERAVVSLGLAEEEPVYRCLAKERGLQYVDPLKVKVSPDLLAKIPKEQIQQNNALPLGIKEGRLYVAIDDPVRTFVADSFAFLVGKEATCALATPAKLKEAIALHAGASVAAAGKGGRSAEKAKAADGESGDDAPIIRLVHNTIVEALQARASDIHIEPFANRIRIRFRIDGVLREQQTLEQTLLGPLTSRLKIMAAMDISEKRKPQDGRIDFRGAGRPIDIRASVLPASHGETLVLRLLDKDSSLKTLDYLGFDGRDYERFTKLIKRPNGIFLVTGPTGSGKTTTLYAALRQLNRSDTKIITAEDPVEFNIAGINQCQVKANIGLTFARILRAMLRQAPNIILVGEIRDRETAEIAVQAALTGHLVFSTLHTNDAPSAITRLIDMGVKPFLVAAGVQAILAQRLMRLLCAQCKEPYQAAAPELRMLGQDPERAGTVTLYRAKGCAACEHLGFRGRVGIFELMAMDPELREKTFRREPTGKLREYARTSAGMTSLTDDGVRKVLEGRTSVDELFRVTAAM